MLFLCCWWKYYHKAPALLRDAIILSLYFAIKNVYRTNELAISSLHVWWGIACYVKYSVNFTWTPCQYLPILFVTETGLSLNYLASFFFCEVLRTVIYFIYSFFFANKYRFLRRPSNYFVLFFFLAFFVSFYFVVTIYYIFLCKSIRYLVEVFRLDQ